MSAHKTVRKPVQKRSREKKERILHAARSLIGKMGLEAVTTNLIAKEAKVSVGTLYAYFKDKDAIFLEVVQRFNQDANDLLDKAFESVLAEKLPLNQALTLLIKASRDIHDMDKALHKEIMIQIMKNPQLWHLCDEDKVKDKERGRIFAEMFKDQLTVKDPEAALFLVHNCVEGLIHHLLFSDDSPGEDRVFKELACMMQRYLGGSTPC